MLSRVEEVFEGCCKASRERRKTGSETREGTDTKGEERGKGEGKRDEEGEVSTRGGGRRD